MTLWTIGESSDAFNNSDASLAIRHQQKQNQNQCHFLRNLLRPYLVASVINGKLPYEFLE